MGIAITSPAVATFGFIKNFTSADVSAGETILSGVASKRIHIRHLSLQSDDAISLVFQDSTPTALIGLLPFGAGDFRQWDFISPMILPTGLDLEIDGDAGQIWGFVQGYIS
jgi:hypothetical protein